MKRLRCRAASVESQTREFGFENTKLCTEYRIICLLPQPSITEFLLVSTFSIVKAVNGDSEFVEFEEFEGEYKNRKNE